MCKRRIIHSFENDPVNIQDSYNRFYRSNIRLSNIMFGISAKTPDVFVVTIGALIVKINIKVKPRRFRSSIQSGLEIDTMGRNVQHTGTRVV